MSEVKDINRRESRFSDDELSRFHAEFKTHVAGYDKAMVRCEQRFTEVCTLLEKNNSLLSGIDVLKLKIDFEENKIDQEKRWLELVKMIDRNTTTNIEIVKRLEAIDQNTKGVVKLFDDFEGAARIGVNIRKAVIWGTSIVGALVALNLYIKHIIEKISGFMG